MTNQNQVTLIPCDHVHFKIVPQPIRINLLYILSKASIFHAREWKILPMKVHFYVNFVLSQP